MRVVFEPSKCFIQDITTNDTLFSGERKNNVYVVSTNDLSECNLYCLAVLEDSTNL